jgi:ATP-dependent RNA helicase DDX49/DBP8
MPSDAPANSSRTVKKRAITVDDLLKSQEEGVSKGNDRVTKRQRLVHLHSEEKEDSSGNEERLDTGDIESDSEEESEEASDEDEQGSTTFLESKDDEDEENEEEDELEIKPPALTVEDRLGSFVKKKLEARPTLQRTKKNPVTSFSSFGISPALVTALTSMSIKVPTPVQAACIPPLLAGARIVILNISSPFDLASGRDCVGIAKTGSGKTIAFALPILQKLSVDPYGIYALVLTPTRYALPPVLEYTPRFIHK